MERLNENQINSMAQEIANLMEQKETENGVNNGKNILGESIWNKFVTGGSDGQFVGTGKEGKKSTINKSISLQNAIKSIAYYIRTKGTEIISSSLQAIGINWSYNAQKNSDATDKNKSTTQSATTSAKAETEKSSSCGNSRKVKYENGYSLVEENENGVVTKVSKFDLKDRCQGITEYYDDGKMPKRITSYNNGKVDNIVEYHRNGKIKRTTIFNNEEGNTVVDYNQKGKWQSTTTKDYILDLYKDLGNNKSIRRFTTFNPKEIKYYIYIGDQRKYECNINGDKISE